MTARIRIQDLRISYGSHDGRVCAVDGVSLTVDAGQRLGIVGESGSGKTTVGMAIGKLLPSNARFDHGDILLEGQSVLGSSPAQLRALRREKLGFVFQNPMTALDPTMRVGRQVGLLLGHKHDSNAVHELLQRARLDHPEQVARKFPHELSGGMAQRVVIALAIARKPSVVIADEPTASLDASIKGAILELLMTLGSDTGASLVIMSHDLRSVARRCDRIAVMYGGRIVEAGASSDVFERPTHPYTQALIHAQAGNEKPGERLQTIPGVPPLLREGASGCAFAPRCAIAQDVCRTQRPADIQLADRQVACHFATEQRLQPVPAPTEAS
ncbi:MAG TPA: ABC transporter ATP-binding protein [Ramlibacter sp.]|jgi:oligopeptide/dipeptide ABC transporter ATP-binding protein|nr:ABC transporter ATP-binding protein [Ramlibacter sp.]